ncbi:hypothetical protein [Chamaesiphon sp. VAR_48_metabat_135_sub]|uniref:hypothetical protein n=1 Tax=Chamaesiphon sp. VAR_48_metabat_135_sub TaxID=2964699 RepID=UPI00286CC1A1|nr:hypothetical protein [Chamaesiphon sp. VAR_48_metabat_135_sub]
MSISSTLLIANGALGNPNDMSGSWGIDVNKNTGNLVIDSDGGKLSGSIFGESIEGFYVSSSRRVVFVRRKNGIPYQLYQGTVSSNGQNMSGQLHVWNSAGGASTSGVDFSFSATKK